MGNKAGGFEFTTARNGEVYITHHGHSAATLRGETARNFLADAENTDPQALMARLTGNYRHGNERTAKNHPRNTSSGR